MESNEDKKLFFSMSEVANATGTCYATIGRAIKMRKIKAVKFGKSVRISRAELERIMKEGY